VFGYDLLGIDADDAKHLEKHAQKIEHAAAVIRKATVDAIMRIGEELSIARDRLANHKNGTFRRWVQQRCGLSNGTIGNILAAYEQFADSKYLPTVGKYVDASAVYLLSSNSCPEEVFDEAMQRAESGEHITQKVVREMIRASAPNEPDADNAGDDNPCTLRKDPSTGGPAGPSCQQIASSERPADAELQALIHAWPALPQAVRDAIGLMVKAAGGGGAR
jgi:hypothetical protein